MRARMVPAEESDGAGGGGRPSGFVPSSPFVVLRPRDDVFEVPFEPR
jgi:hypothetical protein